MRYRVRAEVYSIGDEECHVFISFFLNIEPLFVGDVCIYPGGIECAERYGVSIIFPENSRGKVYVDSVEVATMHNRKSIKSRPTYVILRPLISCNLFVENLYGIAVGERRSMTYDITYDHTSQHIQISHEIDGDVSRIV